MNRFGRLNPTSRFPHRVLNWVWLACSTYREARTPPARGVTRAS